jgi:uncharacterized protein (UPF0332 family)
VPDQMSDVEIQEYIDLANEDLSAAQDNLRLGHLRVAVSRAYYAMFYAATAVVGSQGQWRSKHHGLIAAFGQFLVKPGLVEPGYGRILQNAFEARLDSDYAPHPDLNEASAGRIVTNANDFVGRMIHFLAEHAPVGDEADDATQ